MKKFLLLLLVLPLSACFDADLDFVVHDDDTASMSSKINMGAELYGMAASSGEDPCEDGIGTQEADGTFTCVIEKTDTIDNLIAMIDEQNSVSQPDGAVNPGKGVTLERLEGPFVKMSFDLAKLKESAAQSGMDASMMGMVEQAFQGHRIHMTITGAQIVETNGSLTNDGKTAEITIPLIALLKPDPSLPNVFETVVRTE